MIVVDLQETRRFLSALSPTNQPFIFQTFDDSTQKKQNLVSTFYGKLNTYEDKLSALNSNGAGIFVTINKSVSNSRKKTDMRLARAVWQEDDIGTDKIPDLEPSLVVETSPGKFHRYWFIKDGTQDFRTWSKVQQSLVDNWDSDKNVKDISRVMRLPGFYHQKDANNQFRTRIISDLQNIKYYEFGELVKYFIGIAPEEPEEEEDYTEENKEKFDPVSAIKGILSDDNYHGSQVSLAMRYANLGIGEQEIILLIQSMFKAAGGSGTPRWEARYKEIGKAVSSAFKKISGEDYEEEHPALKVEEEYRESCEFLKLEPPPGMLKEITDNVLTFMRYPSYEIAVETALHVVSVFSGNYYTYDGVPNHRKTIVLAEQGRGKNTFKRYIEELVSDFAKERKNSVLYYDFIGAGDYTSAKQMHLELQEFGSRSMISSEAGHQQATTAGDRVGLKGYENQLLASAPNAMTIPRRQNKTRAEAELKIIHSAALNIIHESVPSNYAELLVDRSQFDDGTLSRSSFIFVDNECKIENINRESGVASVGNNIKNTLLKIADENINNGDPSNLTQGTKTTIEVTTSKGVPEYFDKLEEEYLERRNNSLDEVEMSVYVRKLMRVKQTARLLSVVDNPTQPNITMKHARWATLRADNIDETVLYHAAHGQLSDAMGSILTSARRWCKDYLELKLGYVPQRKEIELHAVSGRVFGQRFFPRAQRKLNKLSKVPAYKFKTSTQIRMSVLEELEGVGYIKVKCDRDIYGKQYDKRRKILDFYVL